VSRKCPSENNIDYMVAQMARSLSWHMDLEIVAKISSWRLNWVNS
jgi:hypothetical protein